MAADSAAAWSVPSLGPALAATLGRRAGLERLIPGSRGPRATRRPARASRAARALLGCGALGLGVEEPAGPRTRSSPKVRCLLELDKALLVQLEKTEEVHDDLHPGDGGRRQLPEARRRGHGQTRRTEPRRRRRR